jgi:SAM-dependent methyltransferase
MNSETFNRLHGLRMENDAARYRQQEMKPRFDRLASRHENGAAPRALSAFQLFQTPAALAVRLVQAAGVAGGSRVLEPSAGLGALLDALPSCDVVAVEMAQNIAGELYRQDRPRVKILQRDFLSVTPAETGLFDSVVMNPPFHMRDDIRHILHAKEFLKPGGTLAALCLDTDHREQKLKPLASSWEKIEAGAFSKQGTRVATALLTIRKSSP